VAAAVAAILLLTQPDAAAAQTEQGPNSNLEEVVVTARKREENLQQTPISVAAFSAAALEARQITNIADLGKFTPNLSFEQGANVSGASFAVTTFIRGVGQTDFNLTIDPGVGLYVDGVYVSRSVGALLDTMDVQSVQVLRGPQGTLFGKNTIGGAVVMTSNRPARDFGALAEITTGTDSRADARAMLNLPINDSMAIRATVSRQNRDGYVRRLSDSGTMGDRNTLAGRVQLLIEPAGRFEALISADYTRSREEGLPSILIAANPLGDFASFHNFVVAGASCAVNPFAPLPECYNAQWLTGDEYSTHSTSTNRSDLDLWGIAATLSWDFDSVQVKSISAYRELESHFDIDTDGSPLPIANSFNDYSQEQFSQELQLTGRAFDDRLKWLGGLYYLREQGADRNYLTFSIASFLSGGLIDNDSYAAFSQLTYEVTERMSLTLGGRYTREKKGFLPDQVIKEDNTGGSMLALSALLIPDPQLNPNGDRILPPVEGTRTSNEFTPSITVDYRLATDVFGYASYSRGFKSGGFTQRVFPPLATVPDFGPEYVTSYEAGIKSELFDRRLRLNGAVYLTNYDDLQISILSGAAPTTRNAGKARIKGFELELEGAPASWLRITAGVGYTDAYYLEVSPLAVDVALDSKLPNAPKWTATSGVTADVYQWEAGTLKLRGDWSYKGDHYKSADNSPYLRQSGVSLVNLSSRFETANGHWSATVGVTNLTDRKYLLSGLDQYLSVGLVEGTYARPREWFLSLRYDY
jgi:iron complex outermembrane receptor protein